VTAGGPTDEFCPHEAGWRIRSRRNEFHNERVGHFETKGRPWMLEPDHDDLVRLLREAAGGAEELRRRGAAGLIAAQELSWDAVAARYDERIAELSHRRPVLAAPRQSKPFPLEEDVTVRVLATPAWRTEDRLPELLAEWAAATAPPSNACLYLLADPVTDGEPPELEARVLAAAAAGGVDLDATADINVLMQPSQPDRDARLHAAVDVYVPLHPACGGHERLARAAGNTVLDPDSPALLALLSAVAAASGRAAA